MDTEFSVNFDRLTVLVIGMAGTGKTTFVNVTHKSLWISSSNWTNFWTTKKKVPFLSI